MAPLHALKPIVLGAFLLAGCGPDKPEGTAASSATASARPSAEPVQAPARPKELGVQTVDPMGLLVGGERIKLGEAGGLEKLTKVVSEMNLSGKTVEVVALKKAKASDVMALVKAFGGAGVASVKLRADGREDLPRELELTPLARITNKLPPCTVVTMVNKDLATGVWAIVGGIGKKHTKGFAGPDLTNTGETLKKDLEKCDSKVAFFAIDESLEWELAHNLGGAVRVADATKKIESLVLLEESPVSGRPVKGLP